MPIVLYRVDDRLVHGQVVIGWGRPLGIGLIIMVDDAIADSEWEQELYRMGVPPEIELRFLHAADIAGAAESVAADPRPAILLTGDIATMAAVCRALPGAVAVNLGGLHHKPGRTGRLPYVFLTEEDLRILDGMAAAGVAVSAQDLPSTAPVPLEELR